MQIHKVKRSVSFLLLVVFVGVLFPSTTIAVTNQVAYSPLMKTVVNDRVRIQKTAVQTAPDTFDVTLTVDMDNMTLSSLRPKPASVVLLFDNSASMDLAFSDGKTRADALRESAASFLDSFLGPDANPANEVSIVAYVNTIDVPSFGFNQGNLQLGLTNVPDVNTNVTSAKAAADYLINPAFTGNTNMQLGLKTARENLRSANNPNKYIVLFSDGVPTASYQGTSAAATDKIRTVSGYSSDFRLTAFDYTVPNAAVAGYLVDGFTVTSASSQLGTNSIYLETISEGLFAEDEGITVFSAFAYGSGTPSIEKTEAEYVMSNVATDSEDFFEADNVDALHAAFDKISSEIVVSSEQWDVADPMANGVIFGGVKSLNGVSGTSFAGVTFNSGSKTLDWDLLDNTVSPLTISESSFTKRYELKYSVSFDSEFVIAGNPSHTAASQYPLNGATVMSYHLPDGAPFINPATANFDVPRVTTVEPMQPVRTPASSKWTLLGLLVCVLVAAIFFRAKHSN